ncbi:MAG: succinate dehydrogenase assembly factor 4 [Alphaproteobacteria bacterium]
MGNLFDTLREKALNPRTAAADAPLPVDPADKVDAKRNAELKAEKAGEAARQAAAREGQPPAEIGGPRGLEPTRYGDWEKSGRCVDF